MERHGPFECLSFSCTPPTTPRSPARPPNSTRTFVTSPAAGYRAAGGWGGGGWGGGWKKKDGWRERRGVEGGREMEGERGVEGGGGMEEGG